VRFFCDQGTPLPIQRHLSIEPGQLPPRRECRIPTNLGLSDTPDGGNEFPITTSTTTHLEPELIAFGRVPAGNTGLGVTGFKQATQAHRFPVISAYDGHRAGVGRIGCDSTWHQTRWLCLDRTHRTPLLLQQLDLVRTCLQRSHRGDNTRKPRHHL
jgi:hypothetical protein